ncbi:MAG: pyridoxamine 5'-phosphate oxidase [Vulcanimicrobiaceae bacterium]
MNPDPFEEFGTWFERAQTSGFAEPNAMSLATADANARPSVRTILLRGWDRRGFTFYTNYESAKGSDLAANPRAALLFFWDKLSRQIRIEGSVEKITPAESDAYFQSRPRGHRLGAWVSAQSRPIRGREELEERQREIEARYPGDVPRPPYWGGYRVHPERFEFWEGRPNRLHDRFVYRRDGELWVFEQLAP